MNVARIHKILTSCISRAEWEGSPIDGTEMVDVWVVVPLIPTEVRRHEAEMIELLKDWPTESWGNKVPKLGEEIDYLVAGSILGSQRTAFLLFAFGKLLGWWEVMEPCSMLGLEKTDPLAQEMAGLGFVAIMGYKPADITAANP